MTGFFIQFLCLLGLINIIIRLLFSSFGMNEISVFVYKTKNKKRDPAPALNQGYTTF